MKLNFFSITNYRSITTAHKIAISGFTVLLGKNNEGKSNILKALDTALFYFRIIVLLQSLLIPSTIKTIVGLIFITGKMISPYLYNKENQAYKLYLN